MIYKEVFIYSRSFILIMQQNGHSEQELEGIKEYVRGYYKEYYKTPDIDTLKIHIIDNYGLHWNMEDQITRQYFVTLMEDATRQFRKKNKTQTCV